MMCDKEACVLAPQKVICLLGLSARVDCAPDAAGLSMQPVATGIVIKRR